MDNKQLVEKMKDRMVQCFGMTQAEVESEYEHSFCAIDGDRLMFAMSILSDAQEEMARGNTETARQFINKAKYHMDIARPKRAR